MNKELVERVYNETLAGIERAATDDKTRIVLNRLYDGTSKFRKYFGNEDYTSAIGELSLISKLYSTYEELFNEFTAYQTDPSASEITAPHDVLDKRIEELEFYPRTYHCLFRGGLLNVKDLLASTESDLMEIRGFGERSLIDVQNKLAEYGLKLRAPEQK